jgi:hypothetical protein
VVTHLRLSGAWGADFDIDVLQDFGASVLHEVNGFHCAPFIFLFLIGVVQLAVALPLRGGDRCLYHSARRG